MKRIAILCVFLSVLYAGNAQDTIVPWYADRYLLNGCPREGWDYWGENTPYLCSEYTPSSTGWNKVISGVGYYTSGGMIYGIAAALSVAEWGCHGDMHSVYLGNSNPLASRVDSLQTWVLLLQKSGDSIRRIDSVHWHYRSRPDWVWRIGRGAFAYEFFFEHPIYMTDSFFVCYSSGGDWVEADCAHEVDSFYHKQCLQRLLYNTIEHYDLCITYSPTWGYQFYDYYQMSPNWGRGRMDIVPIMVPPDTDDIVCVPPVLRYMGRSGTCPVFSWEAAGDEEQVECEIQYSPYNREEWTSRMLTSGPNVIRDEFDPTRYYKARARAKCHHGCAVHDTLVWGDWSEPILFYTGTTEPDTTVGINPVEDAASLFTLTPNPTTGTVRVEIHTPSPLGSTIGRRPLVRGTPPILGGELIVHDAAGHEVMRMKVETGQKAVELDLAALPKGTYLVTLTTPRATGTQRLVLQ